MKAKLKSRKLWVTVAAIAGLALSAWAEGKPVPFDDIAKIAMAYIGGQTLVDVFHGPNPPAASG